MIPIRTILHPTDFSKYSDYAFRLASSLARDYGARLIVLHVEPPIAFAGDALVMYSPAANQAQLQNRLNQIRAEDPTVHVEHRLDQGDAAAEILQVAGETKSDLIVMGTHGRTGLGRLLMGSVAEQVVRKASCPVLTVKTPQHLVSSSEEAVPAAAGKSAEAAK